MNSQDAIIEVNHSIGPPSPFPEQPPAPAVGCNCWEETNAKLREQGYKLSDALSFLQWTQSGPMKVARVLPLARTDGAKLKRKEPTSINISHCPWCGQKYAN